MARKAHLSLHYQQWIVICISRNALRRVFSLNVNGTLSQRQIGEKFKIPKSTVNNIIQKYKNTGAIVNLQERGRKPIFTQREVRTLVRKVKVTPELSAPKLAVKMKNETGKSVTSSCIQKILRKEGYRGCRAKKKPLISKKNKLKRLKFARDHVTKPQGF